MTSAAPMPCSAIILRAAGSAIAAAPPAGGVGFAGDGGGAAGCAAAEGATVAAAVVSITATTSWPMTVAPSLLRISVSTPESGAGNSSTTLSVSTSIRFSSRLTASPTRLCQ